MLDPPPTLQDERSGAAQRNESADSGDAPILVYTTYVSLFMNAFVSGRQRNSACIGATIVVLSSGIQLPSMETCWNRFADFETVNFIIFRLPITLTLPDAQ